METMTVYAIGARRWDFEDDSGSRREGVTIHYITRDGESSGDGTKGEIPMRVTAPASVWTEIPKLPAWLDLRIRIRPGQGGQPVLRVVDAYVPQREESTA